MKSGHTFARNGAIKIVVGFSYTIVWTILFEVRYAYEGFKLYKVCKMATVYETRNIMWLDSHQTHHARQDRQLEATSHHFCIVPWFKIVIYWSIGI